MALPEGFDHHKVELFVDDDNNVTVMDSEGKLKKLSLGGGLPDPPWFTDSATGEIVGTFPYPTVDTTALTIVRDGGGSGANIPLMKVWITDDNYSSYALDVRGTSIPNSDGKGILVVAETGTKGDHDGSLAIGICMGGSDNTVSAGTSPVAHVVGYGHGEAVGISMDVRSEESRATGLYFQSYDMSPEGDNTPWYAGYTRAVWSEIDNITDNNSTIEHIKLESNLHYSNEVTGLLINFGNTVGVGVPAWDGGFMSGVSINIGHNGSGANSLEGLSSGVHTQEDDKSVAGRFHISPNDPNNPGISAALSVAGAPIVIASLVTGEDPFDPADYVTSGLVHVGTGSTATLYLWDDSGTAKLVANINGTKTVLATG